MGSEQTPRKSKSQSISVLLVEDNPGDTRLIQEILAEAGGHAFDLMKVDRLSAGLAQLRAGGVDVVLLDLGLPDSRGLDTFGAMYGQASVSPIVVLSGLDDEDVAIQAVQEGAQDYLVKGQVTGDLLVRAIRYAVERHRMQMELKAHTRELQESEIRFRTMIERNADGVVIVDEQGIIRFVNPATESLFGHQKGELLGKSFEFPMMTNKTLELEVVRKNRHLATVEMRVVETVWEGRAACLASLRDITERKRLEHILQEKEFLEQVNRAKDQFLAIVSHELRTPLNAIIGFTGTLLMKLPGPLNAEQEKQLRTVQNSARHLLSLINDLLDLAKIESGEIQLTVEPVVCQSVLEEVARTLRPAAEAKGLTFEVSVPANAVVVQTDRRALSQILINLANNAIKFTETGSVHLILTQTQEGEESVTEISVQDTGIGLQPEECERVFQAFVQVGPGARRRDEGTGLGLYLSQKLADLMGGRMTVQSQSGQGSRFTLVLGDR